MSQNGKIVRTLQNWIAALSLMCLVACAAPPIAWQHNFAAAEAEGARRNQYLLIWVTADWCASCQQLAEKTWPITSVRRAAGGLIPVRVDVTKQTEADNALLATLGVTATPAVLVWDAREKAPLAPPLVGFASPGVMARAIVSARKAP